MFFSAHGIAVSALWSLLAITGCSGGSGDSPSGCPIDQVGSNFLILDMVPLGPSGGVVLYSGEFGGGLPSTCINRVESFKNQTAFEIAIVEHGMDPQQCPASGTRLGPDQQSPSGALSKIFDESNPKLPVRFTACVVAGSDPPRALSLNIVYRTTSS